MSAHNTVQVMINVHKSCNTCSFIDFEEKQGLVTPCCKLKNEKVNSLEDSCTQWTFSKRLYENSSWAAEENEIDEKQFLQLNGVRLGELKDLYIRRTDEYHTKSR